MLFLKRNCLNTSKVLNKVLSTQVSVAPQSEPVPEVVEQPTKKQTETTLTNLSNDQFQIHPNDLSPKARRLREKQKWFDDIKNLKTIEEKLIKINMPKYYGYKSVMFNEKKIPYNCMPMSQHYTRSTFNEIESFGKLFGGDDEKTTTTELCERLKPKIINDIEYCWTVFRCKSSNDTDLLPRDKDILFGELITHQINRTILNSISSEYPHLCEIEIDVEPRHEAFWWVGGIVPTKNVQKSLEGRSWTKDRANDLTDRVVQYIGKPYMALRHKHPLKSYAPQIDDKPLEVPKYRYDARTLGYSCAHRHGTNIPGFWPGSTEEFGLLSYQKRDHMVIRNSEWGDSVEALHSQGLQSSYAWLFAQACYQGFSSFNDITYPLTTQTIITNGQFWSFYVFQLNTTVMHSSYVDENKKNNNCWGTKELKLYENLDDNGKCVGFNDNVLKNLVAFYTNVPIKREINLTPYLGDEKKVSNIKHEQRREFLEKAYKHMNSNRPRHLLVPEVYTWEKIYKIDNKTRQLESKRRFFELGINPYQRRLDEHAPEYVSKAVRPDGPKGKMRWKKTYYP